MDYNLREMTVDDINKVIVGEKEIFGESLGYEMLYMELTTNPYAHYFVLDIDDEVKGYIGMWIEQDHSEIINFYVSKEYQGMGFGSMFMEFIIELVKMSNVPNISLEVRRSNTKAISLYEKYGFKQINVRKEYYSDREDALVMFLEVK